MIILHFERLGLWNLSWDLRRKINLLGNGIRTPTPPPSPPSGPSVEKQRQQMIKLRIRAAQNSFFLSQHEQIC